MFETETKTVIKENKIGLPSPSIKPVKARNMQVMKVQIRIGKIYLKPSLVIFSLVPNQRTVFSARGDKTEGMMIPTIKQTRRRSTIT